MTVTRWLTWFAVISNCPMLCVWPLTVVVSDETLAEICCAVTVRSAMSVSSSVTRWASMVMFFSVWMICVEYSASFPPSSYISIISELILLYNPAESRRPIMRRMSSLFSVSIIV